MWDKQKVINKILQYFWIQSKNFLLNELKCLMDIKKKKFIFPTILYLNVFGSYCFDVICELTVEIIKRISFNSINIIQLIFERCLDVIILIICVDTSFWLWIQFFVLSIFLIDDSYVEKWNSPFILKAFLLVVLYFFFTIFLVLFFIY